MDNLGGNSFEFLLVIFIIIIKKKSSDPIIHELLFMSLKGINKEFAKGEALRRQRPNSSRSTFNKNVQFQICLKNKEYRE